MRWRLLLAVVALLCVAAAPARAQFCPGVSPWVFDDVAASDPFCGYITWMAQNGISLGCQVVDANHRLYCPKANVSRAAMAAFMNRLGNVRVEAVDTGPGLTGGPITSVGTINLASTQLLPTTACANGQIARWNGSAWACSTDAGSGGTVTSVASGTGLTGGPITSAGTLSIAASYQLPQSCANGQFAKSDGAGGWTCANDANSGGTVTSVATGAGLTGGPITTTGTIDLAATQLLPTVACAAGQVPGWNGSAWVCAAPDSFGANINLQSSTSAGVGNIFKGVHSFVHNYGSANTFVGEIAGNFTMTGGDNTGFGYGTLLTNSTGAGNTAVGVEALLANTTGIANTAVGDAAAIYNTTGSHNTVAGYTAMYANDSGSYSTAIGDSALFSNVLGAGNVAIGYKALYAHSASNYNTAIGHSAMQSMDGNAWFNTAIGWQAMSNSTSGYYNTAVGTSALQSAFGDGNIGIGHNAGLNLASGHDNIEIGNNGTAADTLTIRIGNDYNDPFVQKHTYIAGIRGVTTGYADAVVVVIDSHGQLGTVSSSRNLKDNIADMQDASADLMKLRPVTFSYKGDAKEGASRLQYGLIAEEVAEVYPGLVAHSADGQVETVMYQFLPPMLLNEYQKQQRTIEAQSAEVTRLARELDAQATRIAELERDRQLQMARMSVLEQKAAEAAELKQQVAELARLQRQSLSAAQFPVPLATAILAAPR
ncbi:MAG: tail fiber domain-containing protein [Burkholderiales bacterium]